VAKADLDHLNPHVVLPRVGVGGGVAATVNSLAGDINAGAPQMRQIGGQLFT
jgi:hypothetical protein